MRGKGRGFLGNYPGMLGEYAAVALNLTEMSTAIKVQWLNLCKSLGMEMAYMFPCT